jgi:hypothetical protein
MLQFFAGEFDMTDLDFRALMEITQEQKWSTVMESISP